MGTSDGEERMKMILQLPATIASLCAFAVVAQAQDESFTLPLDGPINLSVPLAPGASLTIPQHPAPSGFQNRSVSLMLSVTVPAGLAGYCERDAEALISRSVIARLSQQLTITAPGAADIAMSMDLVGLSDEFLLNPGDYVSLSFPMTTLTSSITWISPFVQEALNGTGSFDLPLTVSTQITLLGDDGWSHASFYSSSMQLTGEVTYSYGQIPAPGAAGLLGLGLLARSRRVRR